MTDTQKATSHLPSVEATTAPEAFREGPVAAIIDAISTEETVKSVLYDAQTHLAARADRYTRDVGVRAVEVAGKRRASAVDVPDIVKAADELYMSAIHQRNPWAWAVLGIAAGAILSFLITLLAPAIPPQWTGIAAIVAFVLLTACGLWAVRLATRKAPD